MKFKSSIILHVLGTSNAIANPVIKRASDTATVVLPSPSATVLGIVKDGVESFGGIPFAEPPVGQLRLRPPQRLNHSLGTFDGTGAAGACPQPLASSKSPDFIQSILGTIANSPFLQKATGQSEDCLTITVARPANTKADAKLPVLFWIFGGAFELGWSSMYDGSGLVSFGVNTSKPFIFVAVNYRVGGYGFLGGKEILADGAANLGLLDQRMGLEWVADNIAAFGGDPDKVTIWGESAGSMSVLDQMVLYGGDNTYNGKALFRAGIMDSGTMLPAESIDSSRAQAVYDQVVEQAGCGASGDTLACLREVDYETYLDAVSSLPTILSYSGNALSFLPRPDGTVLSDSPDVMIKEGKYAPIPFIVGDQNDEGTLFSLFQYNDTSQEDLVKYLSNVLFKSASEDQINDLVNTYGTGLTAIIDGSPFDTGLLNEIFPGFKRRAALLGDVLFTLTRRAFLSLNSQVNPKLSCWSYLATYDTGTPVMGTFHASDLIQVFYGIFDNYAAKSIRTYYLNFLYSMNPNTGLDTSEYPEWPEWKESNELLNFGSDSASTIVDDFRDDSYQVIVKNGDAYRL